MKQRKTICKHPKPSTIIQDHPPRNINNHTKPTTSTRNYPQSSRIYLQQAEGSGTIHIHVITCRYYQNCCKTLKERLVKEGIVKGFKTIIPKKILIPSKIEQNNALFALKQNNALYCGFYYCHRCYYHLFFPSTIIIPCK